MSIRILERNKKKESVRSKFKITVTALLDCLRVASAPLGSPNVSRIRVFVIKIWPNDVAPLLRAGSHDVSNFMVPDLKNYGSDLISFFNRFWRFVLFAADLKVFYRFPLLLSLRLVRRPKV